MRLLAVLALLLLQIQGARSEPQSEDRVGSVYEIRFESVSQTSGDSGSSGHSRSRTTLVERVIALRDDGVELEFDLPEDTSAEDRASSWQFPVRVLWSSERPLQSLNSSDLEARVRPWLDSAGLTEAACGHWIFTWTAIKIECDPHSALKMIEPFNLRLNDVRDGAPYGEPGARERAPLRTESRNPDGQVFVADMEIDPEAVRRKRAERDLVVAEVTAKEPITIEAALQAWAGRQVSGSMTTTLETDSAGRVIRRTTVTNVVIADADGSQERETSTVTVERRLVAP